MTHEILKVQILLTERKGNRIESTATVLESYCPNTGMMDKKQIDQYRADINRDAIAKHGRMISVNLTVRSEGQISVNTEKCTNGKPCSRCEFYDHYDPIDVVNCWTVKFDVTEPGNTCSLWEIKKSLKYK